MSGAEIISTVATARGITVADIKGPRRLPHFVAARKEVAQLARMYGFSAGKIAILLRRDITTVGAYIWPRLVERKAASRAIRIARST